MRSTEKVQLALDRAENVADQPDADPTVKAAAAMLAMGRGMIDRMIPTDPDKLDELIESGVGWLLSLRSDEVVQLEQEAASADLGDGPRT